MEAQGIWDLLTFNGLIGFTKGVINGTKTASTNNITVCERRLIDKWEKNALLIWNATLEIQIFKIGWGLLDMLYNLDTITQACYRSGREVVDNVSKDVLLIDARTIIDNIIFDFGNIFDSFRDLVLFFMEDNRGDFSVPYDAGYGLGNALYLILRPKPGAQP